MKAKQFCHQGNHRKGEHRENDFRASGSGYILYEKEDQVVTITINRPEVRNCVNNETNLELHDAWKSFRDNDDALVAIFTGAGDKAFSAGWDLNDAAALERMDDYDQFRVAVHGIDGFCGYTKKFDIFKPIIAAINGYTYAAGLENCLLADIRIASENAKFGATERRWNIVAGDGLWIRVIETFIQRNTILEL